MSDEEARIAFGMAGFWVGVLIGIAVMGLPVHADALSVPSPTRFDRPAPDQPQDRTASLGP